MSFTLICPVCQSAFPAAAGLADRAHREALHAALALWPVEVQPQVLSYLGLFKPAQRALSPARLSRVIADLVTLLQAGTVTRHGETRPAPLAVWGAGMADVLKSAEAGSLTLPLTSHALLAEIVYRASGQSQQRQAAAERPLHPSHRPAPPPASGRDPDTRAASLQQVGTLARALKVKGVMSKDFTPDPSLNPGQTAPHTSENDHV